MENEQLVDLFQAPGARWYERLDRSGILVAIMGAVALGTWALSTNSLSSLAVTLVMAGVAIGLLAGAFLLRELYKERCQDQIQQRLDQLDIGLLSEAARAPHLPEAWRRLARNTMLKRACGRAMLLT